MGQKIVILSPVRNCYAECRGQCEAIYASIGKLELQSSSGHALRTTTTVTVPKPMETLKKSISQLITDKASTTTTNTKGFSLWRTLSEASLNRTSRTLKSTDGTMNMKFAPADELIRRQVSVERLPSVIRQEREPLRPALRSITRQSSESGSDCESSNDRRVSFSKYTLLLQAASDNAESELRTLLDRHPTYVNKPSSSGATALHKAAVNGSTECVELLLERGADPNMTDRRGRTAMFLAWYYEHDKCMKLMMKYVG